MRVGSSAELWGERPFTKIMVYGPSGTGKTTWATTAPKPLIFLREEQGLASIIDERADAQVVIIDTWQDFMEAFEAVKMATIGTAKNGQPFCSATIGGKRFHFQTLVIDSFTDMQKLMIEYMKPEGKGGMGALDDADTDNLTVSDWGRIISVSTQVLRDQRAVPCNTIFIFLAKLVEDEKGGKKMIPAVSGTTFPLEVGQYFNGVGYVAKTEGGDYVTLWDTGSQFICKPPCGWPKRTPRTREDGNVSLGSLKLAFDVGENITHEPHDSAEFVHALAKVVEPTTETTTTETETTKTEGDSQ